jgi:soluble lytic murein transglycosylase-like protein
MPVSAATDSNLLVVAADGYARLVARMNAVPAPPSAVPPVVYRAPPGPPPRRAGDPPYAHEIRAAAGRHGVSPALLFAVVEVESNFDPNAQSSKGARGLGQVMPATARDMGVHPARLWHPESNVEASGRYLRWLADRYGRDLDRVLVAYNAGPAVADGQRPVPAETRAYVVKVKGAYRKYRLREHEKGNHP